MNILVTGGAGYIGSAAVKKLIEKGDDVVVFDNLSKGKKELVDKKARFIKGDLVDAGAINKILKKNKFDAVIHFAAYKAVGESMEKPEKYSDNIVGSINLLNAMIANEVKKIIFSSTAAVYGEPEYTPIDENHKIKPDSFYGYTKAEIERLIKWYSDLKGIVGISLRYFNIAGDAGLNYVDPEAQNIFPIIAEVLAGKREELTIFGDDYDTEDGTGVRDYIDINDLIDAHIKALDLNRSDIINLGTSKGVSVMQLVKATKKVSGKDVKYKIGDRRAGDSAITIATNEKAKKVLGWQPKVPLEEMIKSTLKAYGIK